MSALVVVVGQGDLADTVSMQLSTQCQVQQISDLQEEVHETAELVLVLHDAWQPAEHLQAEELFQPKELPWMRGFVSFGEVVVGPLVRPGKQGCSQCADLRLMMGGRDRQEMWELQQRLALHGGKERDAWASRTGLLHASHLIVKEVERFLKGDEVHSDSRVFLINLKTLQASRHFFLPDPLCPVCGTLPEDSPAAAEIKLQPNPKISADSYRCRSMESLKEDLVKDYFDYRTGFLNGKIRDLVSSFADVSVNLPLFPGDESTAGRTHSYADSELTAILEGMERYCGISPRGKRTVVHDSFRNLADKALDPVTVGLHSKEQYERRNFPFKPFDPDVPLDWVWGYSFLQERPILVPELLGYYSLGHGNGFVYETSNGCALGGSLEEAIFYGILEVVERDAFLLTWYAQLSLPRIDLGSIRDTELQLMTQRLRTVAGYELFLYNATMEHGIPSVLTIAKNKKERGVNLICAAGAHLDPLRALKSSIHEIAAMLLTLDEKYEANRENYLRMLEDPFLVQKMEDHSMLYSLPEAESRLHFLLNEDRPLHTFAETFPQKQWHTDLTDDLKDLLKDFREINLDVIVVDQTTPEVSRNGLCCVRVLIPGMLPMTFGHHLSRVNGLERVLKVPLELGYAEQPLTIEQLNSHPHPFP